MSRKNLNIHVGAAEHAFLSRLARRRDATITQIVRELVRDEMRLDRCRKCACSEYDACIDEKTGEPCSWIEDDLCSACDPSKKNLAVVKPIERPKR